MERLNKKIIVIFGIILIIALTFPPFKYQYPGGASSSAEYSFIFKPPKYKDYVARIDVAVLLIEVLIIVITGLAFSFAIGKREAHKKAQRSANSSLTSYLSPKGIFLLLLIVLVLAIAFVLGLGIAGTIK